MTLVVPVRETEGVPGIGVFRTRAHLYYWNGEGPWPGVTTVTDVLDKPALVRWKREQVAQAAIKHAERLISDRERGDVNAAVEWLLTLRDEGTQGRDAGSRVHNALEGLLRGEEIEVDARDEARIDGAISWLQKVSPRILGVEEFLLSPTYGYGGTCDFIAEIDGDTWLLDWKTSKSVAWANGKVYDEMRLQLAAYAHADFVARSADPERYPIPPITRFGIVHVSDGGTRLYEAEVTDEDWIAFRACLRLYTWRGVRWGRS